MSHFRTITFFFFSGRPYSAAAFYLISELEYATAVWNSGPAVMPVSWNAFSENFSSL